MVSRGLFSGVTYEGFFEFFSNFHQFSETSVNRNIKVIEGKGGGVNWFYIFDEFFLRIRFGHLLATVLL